MADTPQNQEVAAQGGTITLDIFFYSYNSGPLTDPDSLPTYEIFDPNGVSKETGTGTKISLGYYQVTYSIPEDEIISDLHYIIWNASINGVNISDQEYFRVVAPGDIEFGSDYIISDLWFSHIKTRLAYPSADQVLLNDLQIKTYIIPKAIDKYFIRFPIQEAVEYEMTSNNELEIDFPDDQTFGVLDARIVGKGFINRGITGSIYDIYFLSAYQGMGLSNSRGMYGSRVKGYNPNYLRQTYYDSKIALDSTLNKGTYKSRVDVENRKVYMYSNTSAKANIVWAKRSNDFDDVRFQFKWDVIELCRAYYMLHLADTASLVEDSTSEVTIDSATLTDKAEKIFEKIEEKWKEHPVGLPIVFRQ